MQAADNRGVLGIDCGHPTHCHSQDASVKTLSPAGPAPQLGTADM